MGHQCSMHSLTSIIQELRKYTANKLAPEPRKLHMSLLNFRLEEGQIYHIMTSRSVIKHTEAR